MKKIILLFFYFFIAEGNSQPVQRTWGTYFGEEFFVYVHDQLMDSQGNIYLVGFSSNSDYDITTPSSYQPTYAGNQDGFLVKLNNQGALVWGTYFGGSQSDEITAISLDNNNHLIVLGNTNSPVAIADTNAYQPTLNYASDYFLASFTTEGNKRWSTYIDTGVDTQNISGSDYTSDVTTDNLGNIYISATSLNQNLGTTGIFQPNFVQNTRVISKFTSNGYKIWATYYGINNSNIVSLACSDSGLYVIGTTLDCPEMPFNGSNLNTYFATPNCYQSAPFLSPSPSSACADAFLSKFNLDGTRAWSTYIGGNLYDYLSRNNIVCHDNAVYITGKSGSSNNMATPGSFQSTELFAPYLAKFSDTGQKLWGTYCGLNQINFGSFFDSSLGLDASGNIYLVGGTTAQNNIATSTGYQITAPINNVDGFVVKFSPTGARLWGTYYGGTNYDSVSGIYFDDDSFYLSGYTRSMTNMTTPNTFDTDYGTAIPNYSGSVYYLALFDPSLATNQNQLQTLKIFPNPNNGTFSISNLEKESFVEIYDVLGKKVHEQSIINNQVINIQTVSKGIYFAKLKSGNNVYKTEKIIIE